MSRIPYYQRTIMPLSRFLLVPLLLAALVACNREQPSGIPSAPAQTPTAAPTPAPVAPATPDPATPIASAPPPLDSEIPAFEKTGYPACDDYVESYRQCINTRLGGEERQAKAEELNASVRSIQGNISRGVDPGRVAALCGKSRGLAAKKLSQLGCAI
jgi:hypothetical protein